ncbi:MAG: tRNA (N(6)-L-threonylcarbamoyladenosine(37)-C(2))-methylthiotransferase [Candidatus Thermoplasmatota archaeon]|nr:tRNA (N(6)-L-threonylcarbamoyladenosine(37)-C(2))-methylthiotransferase [Candidatus Thermoplasmatota archaeon]
MLDCFTAVDRCSRLKIYFESYGCTLSRSEAGLYVNRMISEGNELVESPSGADLSIIGTCVVIKHTQDRMISRIENLSRDSKVRVIGCLPSVSGGELESERIEILKPREFRSFYSGQLDDIEIREPSIFDGIPINQGCTGSCNYCISRVARGKLVSRPPGKIVNQVRMQLDRGIREVRISSLDTAAYGKDLGITLDVLLGDMLAIDGDFMIRIGMMEPKNAALIIDRLLDRLSDRRIFKFLHVPVQSGDDRILELMNREYDSGVFMDIVSRFRSRFPDGTLSTDIISGYHDEDDETFLNTMELIHKTRPDIINITRFSPRPFTPDYDRTVPPSNSVKRWTREYSATHKSIIREKLAGIIGREEELMITEKGRSGTSVGRDHAYRPVVVPGNHDLYSRIKVEIIDEAGTYLIGKIL